MDATLNDLKSLLMRNTKRDANSEEYEHTAPDVPGGAISD